MMGANRAAIYSLLWENIPIFESVKLASFVRLSLQKLGKGKSLGGKESRRIVQLR